MLHATFLRGFRRTWDLRLESAILYGSRARGEGRLDSDADLTLIIAEGAADWQLVGNLAELAYDVFLDGGILIQPVPISLRDWVNPERYPRPGFLRTSRATGLSFDALTSGSRP